MMEALLSWIKNIWMTHDCNSTIQLYRNIYRLSIFNPNTLGCYCCCCCCCSGGGAGGIEDWFRVVVSTIAVASMHEDVIIIDESIFTFVIYLILMHCSCPLHDILCHAVKNEYRYIIYIVRWA